MTQVYVSRIEWKTRNKDDMNTDSTESPSNIIRRYRMARNNQINSLTQTNPCRPVPDFGCLGLKFNEYQHNINKITEVGKTLLGLAVEKRHMPLVRWLLKKGADPSLGKESALELAMKNNHVSMTSLLLRYSKLQYNI
jgi:hypothetical protein